MTCYRIAYLHACVTDEFKNLEPCDVGLHIYIHSSFFPQRPKHHVSPMQKDVTQNLDLVLIGRVTRRPRKLFFILRIGRKKLRHLLTPSLSKQTHLLTLSCTHSLAAVSSCESRVSDKKMQYNQTTVLQKTALKHAYVAF